MASQFFQGKTPFTNNATGRWIVVLGYDAAAAFVANADKVSVQDPTSVIIDSQNLIIATAAGEIEQFPKKMLIPPNFKLASTNAINFYGVQCDSFDEVKGWI
jgi:hypothetical protein